MSKIEPSIETMLENRHGWKLVWNEPWPATGPEGNDLTAHVELRATVHDCVNLARSVAKAHNHPTMGNDVNFLADFIAIHWAYLEEDSHNPAEPAAQPEA